MTPARLRALRSVCSGLAALVLSGAVALSAAGTPMKSLDDDGPDVVFSVTRMDPAILTDGDRLSVGVAAENVGTETIEGLSAYLSITDGPFNDRNLLGSWQAGDLELATRVVAHASLGGQGGLGPEKSAFHTLYVPAGTLDLPEESTEVYGLAVTLEGPTGTLSEIRSFVTWNDDEPRATPVSVIVLGSGSTERVDTLLDTVEEEEVAFAVDPVMLSESAADRLFGVDAFLLPAYNVDLSSLSRAGSSGLLDRALSQARLTAPAFLADAPWLGVSVDVDQSVVTLASDRGTAALLSLPTWSGTSPQLGGYTGGIPPGLATTDVDGQPVSILIPDASLSAALTAGPPGSAATPARVTAETALLSKANTAGNPVVVVVGPSWTIEPNHQSGTFTALTDSPWVELAGIDSVLGSTPATIDLTAFTTSDTDIPVALLTAAGSSLRALDAIAKATDDPSGFTEPLSTPILAAMSLDRRTDVSARDEALGSAISVIDDVRSAVSLPGSNTLNLVSKSGNIPVTVTNFLDVDLTATVLLDSRSPILRIEESPEVTLAAGTSTQVLVPVTAVSSGNVVVRVSLVNADGSTITPSSEYSLRIRAAWGDLFTVVMVGFGMTLLVAGTIRTMRRGKATTRQGPSPEPLAEGS